MFFETVNDLTEKIIKTDEVLGLLAAKRKDWKTSLKQNKILSEKYELQNAQFSRLESDRQKLQQNLYTALTKINELETKCLKLEEDLKETTLKNTELEDQIKNLESDHKKTKHPRKKILHDRIILNLDDSEISDECSEKSEIDSPPESPMKFQTNICVIDTTVNEKSEVDYVSPPLIKCNNSLPMLDAPVDVTPSETNTDLVNGPPVVLEDFIRLSDIPFKLSVTVGTNTDISGISNTENFNFEPTIGTKNDLIDPNLVFKLSVSIGTNTDDIPEIPTKEPIESSNSFCNKCLNDSKYEKKSVTDLPKDPKIDVKSSTSKSIHVKSKIPPIANKYSKKGGRISYGKKSKNCKRQSGNRNFDQESKIVKTRWKVLQSMLDMIGTVEKNIKIKSKKKKLGRKILHNQRTDKLLFRLRQKIILLVKYIKFKQYQKKLQNRLLLTKQYLNEKIKVIKSEDNSQSSFDVQLVQHKELQEPDVNILLNESIDYTQPLSPMSVDSFDFDPEDFLLNQIAEKLSTNLFSSQDSAAQTSPTKHKNTKTQTSNCTKSIATQSEPLKLNESPKKKSKAESKAIQADMVTEKKSIATQSEPLKLYEPPKKKQKTESKAIQTDMVTDKKSIATQSEPLKLYESPKKEQKTESKAIQTDMVTEKLNTKLTTKLAELNRLTKWQQRCIKKQKILFKKRYEKLEQQLSWYPNPYILPAPLPQNYACIKVSKSRKKTVKKHSSSYTDDSSHDEKKVPSKRMKISSKRMKIKMKSLFENSSHSSSENEEDLPKMVKSHSKKLNPVINSISTKRKTSVSSNTSSKKQKLEVDIKPHIETSTPEKVIPKIIPSKSSINLTESLAENKHPILSKFNIEMFKPTKPGIKILPFNRGKISEILTPSPIKPLLSPLSPEKKKFRRSEIKSPNLNTLTDEKVKPVRREISTQNEFTRPVSGDSSDMFDLLPPVLEAMVEIKSTEEGPLAKGRVRMVVGRDNSRVTRAISESREDLLPPVLEPILDYTPSKHIRISCVPKPILTESDINNIRPIKIKNKERDLKPPTTKSISNFESEKPTTQNTSKEVTTPTPDNNGVERRFKPPSRRPAPKLKIESNSQSCGKPDNKILVKSIEEEVIEDTGNRLEIVCSNFESEKPTTRNISKEVTTPTPANNVVERKFKRPSRRPVPKLTIESNSQSCGKPDSKIWVKSVEEEVIEDTGNRLEIVCSRDAVAYSELDDFVMESDLDSQIEVKPKPSIMEDLTKNNSSDKCRAILEEYLSSDFEDEYLKAAVTKLADFRISRIVRELADLISDDTSTNLITEFTPPAPPLTQIQRQIVALVGFMKHIQEEFLRKLHDRILKGDTLDVLTRCARVFTTLCKIRLDFKRARLFLHQVVFQLNFEAVPIVFVMLTCWPEILPHFKGEQTNLLGEVIVNVLFWKKCPYKEGYNKMPLMELLTKHYMYPRDHNFITLSQKLMEKFRILDNKTTLNAILLFTRNMTEKYLKLLVFPELLANINKCTNCSRKEEKIRAEYLAHRSLDLILRILYKTTVSEKALINEICLCIYNLKQKLGDSEFGDHLYRLEFHNVNMNTPDPDWQISIT